MKVAPGSDNKTRKIGWLLLFVALSIVLMTVWSRESDTGPLHRVRVATQTVATPVSAAGKWVSTPFRGFFSWMSDLGVSRGQLSELRDQNKELRARVVALEETRLENKRLSDLLSSTNAQGYKGVTATVIGMPASAWNQVIIVDKGTNEGIEINMPVLGPYGLLGQVIEVGPTYSRIRLLTDQKSGVASLIQRGRKTGITKGSISGDLMLDFISADSTVTAGDVVLTSGLGGVYPKGLLVGEVLEVSKETNALYKSIKLTPANDMNTVENVLILTDTAPATSSLGIDQEAKDGEATGGSN